ncbi:DMT family transporter [Nocardia sp. No.11]|uniref:DMT family transporter n=1 Tax=Nocardia sp. No.11 TaxID=3128861 RepID=UPI00319E503D
MPARHFRSRARPTQRCAGRSTIRFVTGLWSFVVATVTNAVALAVLVVTGRTPRPRIAPLRTVPWWGAAATYVTVTFTVIPQIGAATTIALTVTSQQLVSAAIDHVAGSSCRASP